MSRPNQIIAVLTPTRPMRAATSQMPVNSAISAIMSEALAEYSNQRA